MNIFKFYKVVFLGLALVPSVVYADTSITIRPQAGYGYITASSTDKQWQPISCGCESTSLMYEFRVN